MALWQYVLHIYDFESALLTSQRSYRNLSTRTRVLIGGGIMLYAGFGLLLSDKAEEAFGFTPTEEDRKGLREAVPKIHMVEKEKK